MKYVRALSPKVLVVASVNEEVGDWSAYIDAVKGKNHEAEMEKVTEEGSKITHDLARVIFPSINEKYRWRD